MEKGKGKGNDNDNDKVISGIRIRWPRRGPLPPGRGEKKADLDEETLAPLEGWNVCMTVER